jgi:hypothetical protein
MKPNKCIRHFFKPHNEKYGKVPYMGGFWRHPHPRGNDPTLTNFDGWLDLNPQTEYKVKQKL